jgi:hypothetical protein
MAKQKKKRNKKYTGADAAITTPTVVRITAANRSKLGQWLYERRQLRRPVIIAAVVVVVLVLVIVEVVHLAVQ